MIEALPDGYFRVVVEPTLNIILGRLSGKIRLAKVRVTIGDSVTVEMSVYDLTRGRIVFRNR